MPLRLNFSAEQPHEKGDDPKNHRRIAEEDRALLMGHLKIGVAPACQFTPEQEATHRQMVRERQEREDWDWERGGF
jgi:hypothetical protein